MENKISGKREITEVTAVMSQITDIINFMYNFIVKVMLLKRIYSIFCQKYLIFKSAIKASRRPHIDFE